MPYLGAHESVSKGLHLAFDRIDQVGGEKRRGFGKKRFKQLLIDSESVPLEELGDHLYHELKVFQKDEIRRDDVSIFGFTV